mgnify:CR=1 FL=1
MPIGPGGMPLPYGPPGMPGGGGMPSPMAANPYMSAQPPQAPIQQAGEKAITQLLEMATSNPQLLMGLSMAGAAREISQLTGLSRRRGSGSGGQGGSPAGAMPSAASLLSGNMGDLDRLVALQSMMGGAGAPPMPGGPPGAGGPPSPMPPGMPPGMPGMPGMPPGGGLPPQFAGLV